MFWYSLLQPIEYNYCVCYSTYHVVCHFPSYICTTITSSYFMPSTDLHYHYHMPLLTFFLLALYYLNIHFFVLAIVYLSTLSNIRCHNFIHGGWILLTSVLHIYHPCHDFVRRRIMGYLILICKGVPFYILFISLFDHL